MNQNLSLLMLLALKQSQVQRARTQNIPVANCPGCKHKAHGGRRCCNDCTMTVWR